MMSDNAFPRLAVLLVCHNRRAMTLNALRSLHDQLYTDKMFPVLFDDQSTDGTVEAVQAEYPDTSIVRGDGTAFWNRGLYEAWTRAAALNVDGYLWLNDDVTLDADCFDQLAACWHASIEKCQGRFILVGAVCDDNGDLTYSGFEKKFTPFAFRLEKVPPNGSMRPVDTFEGNFVVVSRGAFEVLGPNDKHYFHNSGDTDYGLRARAKGIDVLLLPRIVGRCEANRKKKVSGYVNEDLPLIERWKIVNTHVGLPPLSWLRLTLRHSGWWWPLHFLLPYRRLFMPRWLCRRLDRFARSK